MAPPGNSSALGSDGKKGKIAGGITRAARTKTDSEELHFVECQTCSRWENFWNCGLGDVYSKEKVEKAVFECRSCKQEARMNVFEDRIKALEDRVAVVESKLGSLDLKFAEVTVCVGKKVESDVVESLLTRIETCETAQSELVVKLSEEKKEPNTKTYAWTVVNGGKVKPNNAETIKPEVSLPRVNIPDKFKDRDNKTVVVVGDSMVRGISQKLTSSSKMFSCQTFGGARIEDISKKLTTQDVGVKDDSHVVIIAGTNNLAREGTSAISKKYRELLENLKNLRCRERSVVGILRRGKDGEYLNSKRLGVNSRLKNLCAEFDVEYVDPNEIYKSVSVSKFRRCENVKLGILDNWGLHLNDWGQYEVAEHLAKHCVSFLA